jgi:hypothetical protein
MTYLIRCTILLGAVAAPLAAQDTCKSGPQAGARPGPYSSVVVTGPHRGTSHCFICETADKPAVIIFARTWSEPLGKLANGIDKALAKHKDADLCAWITFLNEDQAKIDGAIVKWSQKHAVGTVPIAVFEDIGGPPSYRLASNADVTVLLSVKQKVVVNFAFRDGELTDGRIEEVLKAVPELVKKRD